MGRKSNLLLMGCGGADVSAAAYTMNAVSFDGTNDYLYKTGGLDGTTNGKEGILSFWIDMKTAGGFEILFETGTTTSPGLNCGRWGDANGRMRLQLRDSGNGDICVINTDVEIDNNLGWAHILMAWDLANTTGQCYVNDVSDVILGTISNSTIVYEETSTFNMFSRNQGTELRWNAEFGDFYLNTDAYLDISVEANRRKFIDGSGNPVDLGSDGSTPTGSQPVIFLSGATSTWHTNKGYGGGFTEGGAITDGTFP